MRVATEPPLLPAPRVGEDRAGEDGDGQVLPPGRRTRNEFLPDQGPVQVGEPAGDQADREQAGDENDQGRGQLRG
jgi:hypothetical protein